LAAVTTTVGSPVRCAAWMHANTLGRPVIFRISRPLHPYPSTSSTCFEHDTPAHLTTCACTCKPVGFMAVLSPSGKAGETAFSTHAFGHQNRGAHGRPISNSQTPGLANGHVLDRSIGVPSAESGPVRYNLQLHSSCQTSMCRSMHIHQNMQKRPNSQQQQQQITWGAAHYFGSVLMADASTKAPHDASTEDQEPFE
jgi:hypothetical protein